LIQSYEHDYERRKGRSFSRQDEKWVEPESMRAEDKIWKWLDRKVVHLGTTSLSSFIKTSNRYVQWTARTLLPLIAGVQEKRNDQAGAT
jgi:hypothetical protein